MEDFDKKTNGGIEPSQVAKEIAQVEQQISQFKNNVQKAFSGILDSPIDWDKVLMTRQLEVLATKQLTNIQNEMLKIQQATAEGLKLLKEACMDDAVLKYKSYEAMVKVANGNATKIIVPSELQNLATVGTTINEMIDRSGK